MGAFGNYNPPTKYNIDFIKNRHIDVITSFKADGNFIPIYFKYVTDDQEQHIYKINSIKYTRELHRHILFCCLYTNEGKQYELLLSFYVEECLWTIPV